MFNLVNGRIQEDNLTNAMYDYWVMIINTLGLLLFVVSASGFGTDKESGLLKYTLAFGADSRLLYLSKFIFMTFLALIALVAAMIMFVIMLSATGSVPLDVGKFLASAALVLLQFLVIISIGLVISITLKKKGTAILMAFVLMIGTAALAQFLAYDGYNAVQNYYYLHDNYYGMGVEFNNAYVTSHYPLLDVLLMFAMPWTATTEALRHVFDRTVDGHIGTYSEVTFFSLEVDIAIVVLMCLAYLAIGHWLLVHDGKRKNGFLSRIIPKRVRKAEKP
jgi:ABC-type transport system involved in multi-copper enzyme maturation permease subunit